MNVDFYEVNYIACTFDVKDADLNRYAFAKHRMKGIPV